MIKIDIKQFIYNRVWFGYMRAAKWDVYARHGKGDWIWKWIKI